MAPPPPRERLLVFAAALLFLFLIDFRGGVFVYQFHKASSGAWLDEGARLLDGERLYRNFTDAVGPGLLYLNAGAFALGGRRIAVAAACALLVTGLLAAALHALVARHLSWRWRLLAPALLVVVVAPPFDFGHPRWPALALGLLALQRLAVPDAGRVRAAQAGALLGAAALFAADVAVVLVVGVALALATRGGEDRAHPLMALTVACAAIPGAAFLLLAFHAGGRAVAEGWLLEPLLNTLRGAGTILPLRWGVRPAAFLVLSVGGIAAAVAALRRGDAALRTPAMAGLCLAAATLAGPLDAYALAVHTVPLLPLLSVALAAAPDRWTTRLVLAVQILALVHGQALVVLRQWTLPMVRQHFRAGDVWIGAPNVELAWLEEHTRPGDRVFVFPAGGGAFFLTGTRNASAFPYAIEGHFSPARQEQALRELAAHAPVAGVWMGGQRGPVPPGGFTLDRLESGIMSAYRASVSLRDGTLLLEPAGAGAPAGVHSDSGLSGAPVTGTNAPAVSSSARTSR